MDHYLINRTFSAKEHCFSLTTNYSTVLFSLSFQRSEQGGRFAGCSASAMHECGSSSMCGGACQKYWGYKARCQLQLALVRVRVD
jgi:hypothetical protein